MDTIKFSDLQKPYLELGSEIDQAIYEVLRDGNYILGHQVQEFEESFAKYIGTDYAVGVASGLDSIMLALKAIGIKEGDEIIVQANTFIASVLPISSLGAKIVLVDCDENYLIDTSKIELAITGRTKAIIPVHLYGQMCNMSKIMKLAVKYNLKVIEDASQAHGATQNGVKAGSIGDIGCFSLYPAKNLSGIGDGGIATTNNKEYYDKILSQRNYGSRRKYWHTELGTNSRLDTINAAVISIKLKQLDKWNDKRNQAANLYLSLLKGIPQIKLPVTVEGNHHVYHLFVVVAERRDELQKYLSDNNIQTGIHYPIAIHESECYMGYNFGNENHFPLTERFSDNILSLPMHPYLTIEEVSFVCNKIKEFYQ